MVIRPARTDWPPTDEEDGWLKEAETADRHLRIPMTIGSLNANAGAQRQGRLDAVREPETWSAIQGVTNPEGSAKEQIALLKPLLSHGDHYQVTKPYNESMNPYLLELLFQIFDRPLDYPTPQVHVYHGCIEGDPKVLAANIKTELHDHGVRDADQRVHIHFLREGKYRERVIIGSRLTDTGEAELLPAPRWGVAMSHVPGEGWGNQQEASTWSVLSIKGIMRHHDAIAKKYDGDRSQTFRLDLV